MKVPHWLMPIILLLLVAPGCGGGWGFVPDPSRVIADFEPPGPASVAHPSELLIVSYNIQYGEDVETAIGDLRDAGLGAPDVLLLQEMTPAGVDSIASALGLAYVYQPAAIHPHHGLPFGNAVLSRWPITGHSLLVLPHAQPWSGRRRIAVACDLDVGGRSVRVVGLHLATVVMPPRDRFDQAAAVVDSLITGWAGPVVVGGDFNSAGQEDIRTVRDYYRRWAGLTLVRMGTGCTVRRTFWSTGGAGWVLDHIFLRGMIPDAAGIADSARASDHFPVWTRARWEQP